MSTTPEQGPRVSSEPSAPAGAPSAGSGLGSIKAVTASASAIRVLVCDDSAFMRKALSQLINSDPMLTVVDTARNGEEMLEKAKKLCPDVVTLDIEMPVMNGHEALRRLKAMSKEFDGGMPSVLVCSSLTSAGSHDALQALEEGASDIIAKDHSYFSANMQAMRDELVRKIKAVAPTRRRQAPAANGSTISPWAKSNAGGKPAVPASPLPAFALAEPREVSLRGKTVTMIAIGSSTGGPPVLEKILAKIPADLPCPVVIAQHMPASFTKAMSERLDGMSPISVVHGEHGMPLHAGTAYVIPGGQHGRIRAIGKTFRLEVGPEPLSAPYKPSVTELLASVAEHCGNTGVGVVLTGIGDDGKLGGRALLAAGGLLFAQDPGSSVVYGMPRAAAEIGGTIMTPEQVARSIAGLGTATLRTDSKVA